MSAPRRCVLAYSGGLDTSVAVRWLREQLGYEVVTLTADLGGDGRDAADITARALRAGAVAAHVVDARRVFVEHFVFPTLSAGALYEGVYPLATALARPLIAKLLVEVAREEGAVAVAHGCTGKGNDQVRFDVATAALAPELEVVAPVRDWDMGRSDEIAYAAAHGIDVPATFESPFSVDANLWGRSVECGPLEDPWREPPEEVFAWTANPATCDSAGEELTIGFALGIPVRVDGESLAAEELVLGLNTIAGRNGVGRIDHVENRLVGIKSREVYEAPAAVLLHAAHAALETVALPRDVAHLKRQLSGEWARLVYDGLWFGGLRNALAAFVASTQEHVTGDVRVRCARGVVTVTGRRALRSLYSTSLATYDRTDDVFDHAAARGFIELFGLSLRTQARVQGALEDLAPLSLPRQVRRAR
ncbi:MAG: argininosuccinate synthase [Candidatus Dormibacteraeota bacterium]|uniref:Argininosuccinate synthase n=1 Tax=Candidatus Aeolococcus gillhamiae TaxID=3127015 RepID=A0A2W6A091_9BACT|nr:argininosuccinate synthase [Candidatus Dormibacteraeota bacterium]PZR78958.1 MAG: argininosuccinate synthase [Candidatus Dormibacter sp. RRmetagenome_bin12]